MDRRLPPGGRRDRLCHRVWERSADALRLSPSQGGWQRDGRPVLVLSYDAADADQRRLVDALDADSRVRAAAQFFNCFRVDIGAKAKKGETKDAHLSVYTSDGTLVGDVIGQRRLAGAYDLLATAWAKKGGTNFAERVAKMDGLLKNRALAEHYIPLCEVGIVCPDCGEERHDVIERAAEHESPRRGLRAGDGRSRGPQLSRRLTRIIHEGEPEMLSPAWIVVEREISTFRRPRRSVRPSDASEREARGAKWVSQLRPMSDEQRSDRARQPAGRVDFMNSPG